MHEKMTDPEENREHDFDGIVELDNDLPRWWLGIFWVTMLLALFYVPYYHFINPDKLPAASHDAEVAAVMAAREADAASQADQGMNSEEGLAQRYAAGGWQDSSRATFNTFCASCHAEDGGGLIGPNFTDDYYIHGGRIRDLIQVINEGVPAKGMVPWKGVLKPDQIEGLAFHIRSMRGTTPATAKAPEGRQVDAEGDFIE